MMINHVTQLERNKSPVGHIIPIRGFVSCLVLVILLMWPALFVLGQADSRAAMIEEERELKKAQLEGERASKFERRLVYVERNRILERARAGLNGLRLRWGGLPSGGGFAIGPEYVRDDLLLGQMNLRLGAAASTKGYQKYDLSFRLPKLANERLLVDFYSAHRNYPQMQFYGSGPDSSKGQRSNYRLEDTTTDIALGLRPFKLLTLGGASGYVWTNVGPGTSSVYISTEEQFTPEQAPGIDRQTDFFRYGAFAQFDYRDDPLGPRKGGNYVVQHTWYDDRKLGTFDFRRLDVTLEQYVPFFNKRRVFAFRARTVLTDTRAGQVIPFYMQPTLGGGNDLRGFRPFRFSDKNSADLTAEYRWEAFSGLDMAIFFDAGKVFSRRGELNFSNMEGCGGFGFRFNVRNRTFIRMDFGWSHEGFQFWFKFNDIFRPRRLGTVGAQPFI
jgi:outer membrane protein assembly factor BamA